MSSIRSRGVLLGVAAILLLSSTSGSALAASGAATQSKAARAPKPKGPKPKGVDRRSLKTFLSRPWTTTLLPAMAHLQKETATSPSALDDLYVSGKTTLRLSSLSGGKHLEIAEAGQTRPASVEDLRALGITSVAKLQALLRQRLRPFFNEWGYVLSHDYQALENTVDIETARLERHVWDLRSHRDVQLLLTHQYRVTQLKNPTAGENFTLFDEGGDDKMILVRGPGFRFMDPGPQQLAMFDGDKLRDVRFGDLARLHLGTQAEFDAMLARHLVRVSGVQGDASNPGVVAKARLVLHQQMSDMENFAYLVFAPQDTNTSWCNIAKLMVAEKRSSVVVWSRGATSLNIVSRERSPYEGPTEVLFKLVENGLPRDIKNLRDLAVLNIPDRAALEAALANTWAELQGKRQP